jgi:hypothetical protein
MVTMMIAGQDLGSLPDLGSAVSVVIDEHSAL